MEAPDRGTAESWFEVRSGRVLGLPAREAHLPPTDLGGGAGLSSRAWGVGGQGRSTCLSWPLPRSWSTRSASTAWSQLLGVSGSYCRFALVASFGAGARRRRHRLLPETVCSAAGKRPAECRSHCRSSGPPPRQRRHLDADALSLLEQGDLTPDRSSSSRWESDASARVGARSADRATARRACWPDRRRLAPAASGPAELCSRRCSDRPRGHVVG